MPRIRRHSKVLEPGELKEWRDTLNITQAEAAYLMGISPRQYSNLELGKTPISKAHMLGLTLIIIAAESLRSDFVDFELINQEVNKMIDDYFPEE